MADPAPPPSRRKIGLFGATSLGVGAIVGGGILALAGTAFAVAGPAALLAFALNAGIAFLTALSFAELATMFPQSGGAYAFAKRVLSVRAAFTIGWIVWFASIVAGVLYALGFAEYARLALDRLLPALGLTVPGWLLSRAGTLALAGGATVVYALLLARGGGGGGNWINVGKVAAFAVLIAFGLAALVGAPAADGALRLTPFFPGGVGGLLAAMGFTFIAFQGFGVIAAAAGEVDAPARTVPRAMLLALTVAVVIYLPLLLVIATVGVPEGESVRELARAYPDTLVAVAARGFMGAAGFWLVVAAAVLSMLSALQANLFAASRIATAMAADRTLPRTLGRTDARGTPAAAVWAGAVALLALLLLLPDVAAAGAAASLIFLAVFTLVHGIAVLARLRSADRPAPFRTPLFPLVPVLGGVACASLALFQGVTVPSAGAIALVWLLVGAFVYLRLFARHARALDALAEARDPRLLRLRGRSPLVLAPVANPANAAAMVTVADALAPRDVGRVLLLSVVTDPRPGPDGAPAGLERAQRVLRASLASAYAIGLHPEALTTVAPQPWREIARVAHAHQCEGLLIGLSDLGDDAIRGRVNELLSEVDSDVVVLRSPPGWKLSDVRRVLIPIAGAGHQEELRARLLGSLTRVASPEVTYLRVVPPGTTGASRRRIRRGLERLTEDPELGFGRVEVRAAADPVAAIATRAEEADLVLLGLQRASRTDKRFGEFARRVADATPQKTALVMISRRG